jgi:hypothetical protein
VIRDMTYTEENLQITPDGFEPPLDEPDDMEDYEAGAGRLARRLKGFTRKLRGSLLGLAFLVGLLLGWIVIGWWLWPVKWTNSEPWLLRPEHQRTYIGLVAENYWHTGDVSRARKALAGWDGEALTELLAGMQSQASSPEEHQHLAALAEALALPNPEESLLTSFLSHKLLVMSALLSAAPLVVAMILVVSPLVRDGMKRSAELLGRGVEESDLEHELEELLIQEGQQAEEEGNGGEAGEEGEIWGEEKGEETEKEEHTTYEQGEWLDEEAEEEGQLVQNILSSVFEEEDETFDYYESLCKGLADIDIDDLVQKSREIMDQIMRSNALHQA